MDSDRHIILYSKGWYTRSANVVDDMRVLVAERCGLEREHVSDADLWHVLVGCLERHCDRRDMQDILDELFRKGVHEATRDNPLMYGRFDPSCPVARAVYLVLRSLGRIRVLVDGVAKVELGEPDPSILPLSRTSTAVMGA